MENNLVPNQNDELKRQLEATKRELELLRSKPVVLETSSQDKFVETLFEKGGELLIEYNKLTLEKHRYTAEKDTEVEKEELKIIDKLDSKEKIYKGTLISVCILALVLSAMFIPKSEIVIPVLSLIIGLLFKSSSLSDFFSHSKGKYKDEQAS